MQMTPPFTMVPGMNIGEAVVIEIILTFGLMYTVYMTTIDLKKDSQGSIAPLDGTTEVVGWGGRRKGSAAIPPPLPCHRGERRSLGR